MDIETYRNPFTLRASEKIADEETFIKLLSTQDLLCLKKKNEVGKLWGNVMFVQRPPGGGKTTLLRAFSVKVLSSLIAFDDSFRRNILNIMQNLDVITDKQIKKCGVYLLMNRDYSYICNEDNLNIDKRTFFTLLNARITLAVVKTIIEITGLDVKSLENVLFCPPEEDKLVFKSADNIPTNALELYHWAKKIEDVILTYYNGFDDNLNPSICYDELFVFKVLKSKYFIYEDVSICDEFIFQLDDIHKLSKWQHKFLVDEVVEKRSDASLWLAERLDLVPLEHILGKDNKENRDYNIFGEMNNNKPDKRFAEIAYKRCQIARYSIILNDSLEDNLNYSYDIKYKNVIKSCSTIFNNETNGLFSNWIKLFENEQSLKTKAIAFKSIEMYFERLKKKSSLPMFPFESSAYSSEIDNNLKKLSWSIICSQNDIPLYYGFNNLEILASYNVEQFIDFSSKLYETIVGKYLVGNKKIKLDAREQDIIIKKHSKELFERISYLTYGENVKTFLENLIAFCKKHTFAKGSSYSIVTGFAIKDSRNSNFDKWYDVSNCKGLKTIVQVCLANNLLIHKKISQGGKGEYWEVYYLNRWLCVYGNLPLYFGGWRKSSINDIYKWIKE